MKNNDTSDRKANIQLKNRVHSLKRLDSRPDCDVVFRSSISVTSADKLLIGVNPWCLWELSSCSIRGARSQACNCNQDIGLDSIVFYRFPFLFKILIFFIDSPSRFLYTVHCSAAQSIMHAKIMVTSSLYFFLFGSHL